MEKKNYYYKVLFGDGKGEVNNFNPTTKDGFENLDEAKKEFEDCCWQQLEDWKRCSCSQRFNRLLAVELVKIYIDEDGDEIDFEIIDYCEYDLNEIN